MSEQKWAKHESAIVDSGATIGARTRIWHFTHVSAGADIGTDCVLGQNVYVGNDVKVGKRCKIQNNVSVYDSVTLHDDVFCGPSVVFTNVYNPRSAVVRKNEYRPTVVKTGASLGANSTIVCGVTIGEFAFVGAGTLVNRDVRPYALVVGVPGRQVGWMSEFGERIPLPLEGSGEYRCPQSGTLYVLSDGELRNHPANEGKSG